MCLTFELEFEKHEINAIYAMKCGKSRLQEKFKSLYAIHYVGDQELALWSRSRWFDFSVTFNDRDEVESDTNAKRKEDLR